MKKVAEEINDLIQAADTFAENGDFSGSVAWSLLAIAKLLDRLTSHGEQLDIRDQFRNGI